MKNKNCNKTFQVQATEYQGTPTTFLRLFRFFYDFSVPKIIHCTCVNAKICLEYATVTPWNVHHTAGVLKGFHAPKGKVFMSNTALEP